MVFSTAILAVILVVVLWGYLTATGVAREVWYLAGFAFLARVGFAVLNHVTDVVLPSDEPGYHRTLQFVTEQWYSAILEAPFTVGTGPGFDGVFAQAYSVAFGPIYAIFGTDMINIRLTMALLGTLVVINLYRIGREIHSHRGGLYAAAITAVFPYWIYLSGILYRDMLVILLFTWTVYYLLRWQSTASRRAMTLCLLTAGFGLSLRPVNIPAVAVMISIAVYTNYEPTIRQKIATVIAIAGSGLLFLYRFGDEITVEALASRRRWLSRENPASYLTEFAYETVPELIAFAPIGTLYFLLVPFPWQAVNVLATASILQNFLIWYPVVALAILGGRDLVANQQSRQVALPLIGFVLVGLSAYGLVEGNIGPAMRHRSQFQFVFFAFAGVALARRVRFVVVEWMDTHGHLHGSTIS